MFAVIPRSSSGSDLLLRAMALLAALGLLIESGGVSGVVQAAGWAWMLVDYSRDAGIDEAVDMTFNGENPCCLCKLSAALGQDMDPQNEVLSQVNSHPRILGVHAGDGSGLRPARYGELLRQRVDAPVSLCLIDRDERPG